MRSMIHVAALVAGFSMISAVLMAQYPDPGSMGGTGRAGEGFRQRTGPPPERALPSEVQLEGPPLPEFFVPRFQLDSGQARRYRAVYDSFMSATARIRDSAQAARRHIDAAFQNGDRRTARAAFPLLRQLGDSLARLDAQFDDGLKPFLTSRQRKSYKKWRDQQRRQQEEQQRDEMQRRLGTPRNGRGEES